MKRHYILSGIAALTMIAACGSDTGDTTGNAETKLLTAATIGEQMTLTTGEFLAQPQYAAADPENGARQAQICKACHSLEKGGVNMIGPNLYGFFGEQVGTVEGFDYSNAVANADFVWTPRALDAWLVQPSRFLPGNRMTFAGVGDAGNRADLIAYLLRATDDGNNTDE
jgi:cytochrome c